MGLTHLDIEIGNPANPETTETVRLLVDSGAAFSVIPTSLLERLGIRPHTEQQYSLADGSRILRKRGGAFFRYGERTGVADVILGEPDDSLLLGEHTLEALGLGLDPLRRELIELPMLM